MRSDLVTYLSLPFYRSMLERSGFSAELAGFDEGMAAGDVERAKAAMSEPMLDSLGGFGDGDAVRSAVTQVSRRGSDIARGQPGAHRRLRGDPRSRRRADLGAARQIRIRPWRRPTTAITLAPMSIELAAMARPRLMSA